MPSNPTVSFHTLGCKLNFAESATIGRQLKDLGFRKVSFEEAADVVVINTCSVTENADRECRAVLRKALKTNPDAFVAVIGCYAQLKPGEIAAMDGVDLVLGATEKFNLAAYLGNFHKRQHAEVHSCEVEDADRFVAAYSTSDRTRSFLKVQDGCDYNCSYCTIPLARGRSRSASIADVVRQAEEIASSGIREIVLTGVNIGDFGAASEENFLGLIRALDEVSGIERFRISSIEPNLLSDEIIRFVSGSKKFAPHFHIPLQSGSDKILKLMRRRYLRGLYRERVNLIKQEMPDCCIGVDVIVGFPGETDADFQDTYAFLNELDVSYFHVFTYSERDDTDASSMSGLVPVETRKTRNKMLRILSEKKLRHFYSQQAGTIRKVIFETENKDGWLHGFTDNYVKVRTPFDAELVKQTVETELGEAGDQPEVSCNIILSEPA